MMRGILLATLLALIAGCGGGGGSSKEAPGELAPRDLSGAWSGTVVSNYDGSSEDFIAVIHDDEVFVFGYRQTFGHGVLAADGAEWRSTVDTASPIEQDTYAAINSPAYVSGAGAGRLVLMLSGTDTTLSASYRALDSMGETTDEGTITAKPVPLAPVTPSALASFPDHRFRCGTDEGIYPLYCYADFTASQDGENITGRYEERSPYNPRPSGLYRNVPKAYDFQGVLTPTAISGLYAVTLTLPDADPFIGVGWQPEGGAFQVITRASNSDSGPPFIRF